MKSIAEKRYSIDIDFTVIETRLVPFKTNEMQDLICKQVETKYNSNSITEAEIIIRLLKDGVTIKQSL